MIKLGKSRLERSPMALDKFGSLINSVSSISLSLDCCRVLKPYYFCHYLKLSQSFASLGGLGYYVPRNMYKVIVKVRSEPGFLD